MHHRIGIFGGSFNPVHLGHLNIASTALQKFELDKVIFIPCKVSPFKTGCEPETFVDDVHRLKMIELSIQHCDKFELSLQEINRGGVSYSFDTVSDVKRCYSCSDLFFIIGSDTLITLSKWYKIHALLNMCEFVTVNRPGVTENLVDLSDFSADEYKRLTAHQITGRLFDISSSDIRKRIAAGESINGLVEKKVEKYIIEHRLYVM